MRSTIGHPAVVATFAERDRVRRVRAADHDDRVGLGARSPSARPGGWWSRSRGRCGSRSTARGTASRCASMIPSQSCRASVVCASSATLSGSATSASTRARSSSCSTSRIDVGRDRERAHGFVVAGVADVEDREALVGPDLRLVVHLGDERAHRVDDEPVLRRAPPATTSGAEPCAESMSGAPAGTSSTSSTNTTPERRGSARRRAGCARSRGSSRRAARRCAPSTPAP